MLFGSRIANQIVVFFKYVSFVLNIWKFVCFSHFLLFRPGSQNDTITFLYKTVHFQATLDVMALHVHVFLGC